MENGRIQLYGYRDANFNVHHSVSSNYQDPYTNLHMHSEYELYLFLDGDGKFNVSGNIYTLIPGTVMFMRPGEAHSLSISTDKRYERIAIHFNRTYFEENHPVNSVLDFFDKKESGFCNCFIGDKNDSFITKLFHEMTDDSVKNQGERLLSLEANIPALLYSLSKSSTHGMNPTGFSSDTLIRQIVRFIDTKLYEEWNLDDLAASLYRDKAYLNRCFKKAIGTGIWDYTIRKRIIGIKQKIHSFSNVNDAFRASGFKDYSTFFRNYVRITGVPPSSDLNKDSYR